MSSGAHALIAAHEEDAMNYAWDPQYDLIKYVGEYRRMEGMRITEASFTPLATMQPNWTDALRHLRHSVTMMGGDAMSGIHIISLYSTPEKEQHHG